MSGRLNCPPWHCRHPSQEVKNRLFCQSFLSGGFFPHLLVESFFQIAKSIPRYGKQIRVCLQIKSSETVKLLTIKPCWPRGEFPVEGEGGREGLYNKCYIQLGARQVALPYYHFVSPSPYKVGRFYHATPSPFFSFFLLFFDMHLSQAGKQNNPFMDDLLIGSHMNHSTA